MVFVVTITLIVISIIMAILLSQENETALNHGDHGEGFGYLLLFFVVAVPVFGGELGLLIFFLKHLFSKK